jgi:PAS domain S-box-containing protein
MATSLDHSVAAKQVTDVRADILAAVFEQAPVGVGVCDEDGRFVAVNDCLLEMLQYRRSAVVGRPFLNFVHPAQRAVSLARYFESVVAAAAPGLVPAARYSELQCVAADGTPRWLAVTWTITSPDDCGLQYGIVHLRDVTHSNRLKRELAAVRARLALAFDHAPIGMAVVGLDGRLLETNRALHTLLGYDEDELANLTFVDITYPADRADAVAVFNGLRAGAVEVHETVKRYVHRDGHVIHARRVAAMARAEGEPAGYLLLQIEDITAERVATERLAELDA